MNCTRKILCAGLALCAAGAGWAMPQAPQQDPPQAPQRAPQGAPASQSSGQAPTLQGPDPRAKIRTTVSLVIIPVTVKNGAGELVSDLQQKDFRIFEDGIEQQIALFFVDAVPLSAAVLIDDDLKRSSADRVQKTLETLAAGFIASDEVSLCRFDEVSELISESGFIADNDALLTQLKRIDLSSSFPGVGSAPMTSVPRVNTQAPAGSPQRSAMSVGHPNFKHINDAIYAASEQLRDRPRERRKIIFLISDGQNAKNNTHSYDETLKLLLSAA